MIKHKKFKKTCSQRQARENVVTSAKGRKKCATGTKRARGKPASGAKYKNKFNWFQARENARKGGFPQSRNFTYVNFNWLYVSK